MFIDLSIASDDGLALILLRVPVKDLIGKCTQVSPQWNRILSESYFWRNKMDYDGYHLDWPKLVGLSTRAFQTLALKHCFKRNFIKDCWHFNEKNERRLKFDPRWRVSSRIYRHIENNIDSFFPRFEIPPKFLDGQPEIPPGIDKPIAGCIAIGNNPFKMYFVIKLADEGLTDEIMDNYRPTIVVTQIVGNRRDCKPSFAMHCCLDVSSNGISHDYFREVDNINENLREYREERSDEKGRWVGVSIALHCKQSEAESWKRVEHTFKDYPIGMRYLTLEFFCMVNFQNAQVHRGLKLANCSVKALCEKNAN